MNVKWTVRRCECCVAPNEPTVVGCLLRPVKSTLYVERSKTAAMTMTNRGATWWKYYWLNGCSFHRLSFGLAGHVP